MDIAYATRSKFLEDCEAAINHHRAELDGGTAVRISLGEGGGYGGKVVVTIRCNETTYFGTDWEGADPTRFPARIKAGATALLNCGCEGRFEITHSDGSLAICSA
jgi:hypothetical protein